MSVIYKIYFATAYVLFSVVCILLINEIHELLTTVILYLCLSIINVLLVYFYKEYKEATNEMVLHSFN